MQDFSSGALFYIMFMALRELAQRGGMVISPMSMINQFDSSHSWHWHLDDDSTLHPAMNGTDAETPDAVHGPTPLHEGPPTSTSRSGRDTGTGPAPPAEPPPAWMRSLTTPAAETEPPVTSRSAETPPSSRSRYDVPEPALPPSIRRGGNPSSPKRRRSE